MTPAQHVAFTRRLGPLHVMEPLEFNLPGYPEVFVVSNVEEDDKPVGMKRAGWGWHSDGEDKVLPNAGSFLYALELPPEGGDTLYADTYAAFAALPERRAREDPGPARVLQPRPLPPRPLPAPGAADRRAEGKRARRVAPDRAAPPALGLDLALHRPLGVRGRGHARRRGARADPVSPGSFATRADFVYRHRWRVGDAVALGQPLHAALRHGVRRDAAPATHAPDDARGRATAGRRSPRPRPESR